MLRQATLVAFHGPKPSGLEQLFLKCQDMILETQGIDFRPYDVDQIHGTIIGLEKVSGEELINKNMACNRGRHIAMDIDAFARDLQDSPRFPITLQFGGYAVDDVSFTSRDQPPYDRSFSIQGDKAVLIGWPVSKKRRGKASGSSNRNEGDFNRRLDDIRKRAQVFNILHTYHVSETDVDNDFYMRLGLIKTTVSNERHIHELTHRVRTWLSRNPFTVDLSLRDLTVASYLDEMLPMYSTRRFSIASICRHREEIEQLYV